MWLVNGQTYFQLKKNNFSLWDFFYVDMYKKNIQIHFFQL